MNQNWTNFVSKSGIALVAVWLVMLSARGFAEETEVVSLLRVPEHGIQPQAVLDSKGIVHLIYFKGDPKNGDIFYVRTTGANAQFSGPIQVNSQPGSAIAMGNVRGGHLAIGKNGRVHVAWMGSSKAEPAGAGDPRPMLYTRMNNEGTAFEAERNVIQYAPGLDGGGSVAADERGNVYVAWHAPQPNTKGEQNRCVWVTHSANEGKTFDREQRANVEPTGACGCCGMRAFADSTGALYLLYRSTTESVHRDMYLLVSKDNGKSFEGQNIHEWNIDHCPMSTAAFGEAGDQVLAGWETKDQVYFARINRATANVSDPISPPGLAKDRKHPVVAGNSAGESILVWTEGMGWNRGGSLAWQVFDKAGKPTAEKGYAKGVPTWSLVGVFARPDGGFTILY